MSSVGNDVTLTVHAFDRRGLGFCEHIYDRRKIEHVGLDDCTGAPGAARRRVWMVGATSSSIFISSELDKVTPPDQVRSLAAVAIVVAVVMVVVLSVEHDSVMMMVVSVTDANSDAADIDTYAFRDDHRLVAGVQGSRKCRHRQHRNKKKGEQNILHHGTPIGLGTLSVPIHVRMPTWYCWSLYRIDQYCSREAGERRGPAGAYAIKVMSSCPV
jgi:hypothetical protein